MAIRHNYSEAAESIFGGVVPKDTFGMDDFSQSVLPNADTGYFDTTINDDPFQQNDPEAANIPGVDVDTPGVDPAKKLENATLDEGLNMIREMLNGPEPHEQPKTLMEAGMDAIREALGGI